MAFKHVLPWDEKADGQGYDQAECVSANFVVRDLDISLLEDHVTQGKDPERHHEEGGEGGDGGHCDGQVQVATVHQGPVFNI